MSEIEKLTGTSGMRNISWALATVSSASTAHRGSGGVAAIEWMDVASTYMPVTITHAR